MRRNRKRCASKIQGEGAEIKQRRRGVGAARAQPSSRKAPRGPPSFGAGRRGFPPLRAPAVVTPRGFPCPDAGGLKALRAVRSRRPLGAGDPRVCETAERENGLTHPEAPGAAVGGPGCVGRGCGSGPPPPPDPSSYTAACSVCWCRGAVAAASGRRLRTGCLSPSSLGPAHLTLSC